MQQKTRKSADFFTNGSVCTVDMPAVDNFLLL